MKKLSLENKRNINGGKCNNYKNAALGAGKGTVQGACS